MDEQQRSTADEMESGLNTGAETVGQAIRQGLPSRREPVKSGKTIPNDPVSSDADIGIPNDGKPSMQESSPHSQSPSHPEGASQAPEGVERLNSQVPRTAEKTAPDGKSEAADGTQERNRTLDGKGQGVSAPDGNLSPSENGTGPSFGAETAGSGTGAAGAEAAGAGAAEAGAAGAGSAAGGAAAGVTGGAAAGATVGSAAGPAGTAAGALAGALLVPVLKLIFMAVAVVAVFLTAFMMQPSFLYDNPQAVNDRVLLEDSYNSYYSHIENEYGKDITSAMNKAQNNAWELFREAGRKADRGDPSLLFSAPAAYPYVSISAEDQAIIRDIMDDSSYDYCEFYHSTTFLHDYETYLKAASSNINMVLSIIDTQKKNWFSFLFEGIADLVTGGHYSQFTDWIGRKWDGIWNDFIQYDLYSISYGGVTIETETIYISEDETEEIVTAYVEIVYTYDLKDLGVGFYANKLGLEQEQIDRAAEVANYLADLFGSASDTYFGWYVEGGYHTDAVQGGTVGVNINSAFTSLADKIEGMEYDPDSTHIFPLRGYDKPNMSSPYGPRDFAADSWHTGIDFAAPSGTEIQAVADGVVLFIAQMPHGFGNYIVVYHGEYNGQPVSTMYAHMSGFGSYRAGDQVSAGDTIGYVGSTGLSTGPHLHFQLHVGDTVRNPVEFFDFLGYLKP